MKLFKGFKSKLALASVLAITSINVFALPCNAYEIEDKAILVYKEAEGFTFSNKTVIPADEVELPAFEEDLANAIVVDIQTGLDKVMNTKTASSHIAMEKYGEFLNKTVNKTVSEMSSDLPYIELNGVTFKFNSDRSTKAWVESFLKEKLTPKLKALSDENIVSIYNIKVSSPTSLKDLKFEDYSSNPDFCVKKLGPLTGVVKEGEESKIDTLAVHNTGKAYGLQLNSDFSDILNKATESQGVYDRISKTKFLSKKYNLSVPYTGNNSNSVLSYTASTEYGVDLSDKTLYDVTASNMGMNVEVADTIQKYFQDNLDDYLVVSLDDGTFVAKKTYAEYFKYGDNLYPTYATVDLTDYFSGQDKCKVILNDKEGSEDMTTYYGEDKVFTTTLASADFMDWAIVCDSSYLPVKRILSYAGTNDCRATMGEEVYQKFANDLKSKAKSAGLTAEYKQAFKSLKNNTPIYVCVGVVLLIGVIILIIVRRKKRLSDNSFVDTQEVLDEEISGTPQLHHTSRVRGLKNKNSVSEVTFESNDITDDSGVTEFSFLDEEDE